MTVRKATLTRRFAMAVALFVIVAGCLLTGTTLFRVYGAYYEQRYPHRTDIESEGAALKVLWIGNSHSFSFGLVGKVQSRAESEGDGPVFVRWVRSQTLPGVSEALPRLLAEDAWDVVVLQPQSVSANHDHPKLFRRLNDTIRIVRKEDPSVRVMLYENWRYTGDSRKRTHRQEEIDALFCGVKAASKGVDIAFVGHAFTDEDVADDGNHMSAEGAEKATRILHQSLMHSDRQRRAPPECQFPAVDLRTDKISERLTVFSTRSKWAYDRPNRYGILGLFEPEDPGEFARPGYFGIDGYMGFATAMSSDQFISPTGPWVEVSERLPGTYPSSIRGKGPQRIGGVPVVVHGTSVPWSLKAESLLLEIEGDVWFIGDGLSHPCPPMAETPREARAVATWLRTFGEEHPDATVYGTAGARVDPGGLEAVAEGIETYAIAWERGDTAEMKVLKAAFAEHEMCNEHWAFQGVAHRKQ